MKTKKVNRSSVTGKFVTKKEIEDTPDVTFIDTVPVGDKKVKDKDLNEEVVEKL